MRLFVAVQLDERFHATLAAVIEQLRQLDRTQAVRWLDDSSIHLTLKFLGEVEPDRIDRMGAALEEAVLPCRSPSLGLTQLGGFPSLRRPSVVWAGIRDDGGRLAVLQKAVEAATIRLGWPFEERAFQPHLTVGRLRDSSHASSPLHPALASELGAHRFSEGPARPQPRVALFRSHLGPAGARYEAIRVWTLPGPISS